MLIDKVTWAMPNHNKNCQLLSPIMRRKPDFNSRLNFLLVFVYFQIKSLCTLKNETDLYFFMKHRYQFLLII